MDDLRLFHLTGVGGAELPEGMRPAAFARYGDMARVRHDFPVVLAPATDGRPLAIPLSALVDEVKAAAPRGLAGERQRRTVLRIEREIRALVAAGERGDLRALWAHAVDRLAARGGAEFVDDAARAAGALSADGPLAACDAALPRALIEHAWREHQRARATKLRRRVEDLALRLGDLVRGDLVRSQVGRGPDALRAGVGAHHERLFDFDVMARLLSAPSRSLALSPARRSRIARTVGTLRTQRFVGDGAYDFVFGDVGAALRAYHDRRPELVEVVRALAIAELEVRGAYDEEKHDHYFASFTTASIGPADLALFPDYLVFIDDERADASARAKIIEMLVSEAPLKIVFVTDDAFGLGAHLATTAMGLGEAFVLQATAADLVRCGPQLARAIAYPGPTLISVFAPDTHHAVAGYLGAAGATESRAFPTFTYDPARGDDWAQRFELHAADKGPAWPIHAFEYRDGERRGRDAVAFTPADLALCDPRHAGDFSPVSRAQWSDALVPIDRWLAGQGDGKIPFVYGVDANGGLHKLVVTERLALLASRSAAAWRRLRELEVRSVALAPSVPVPIAEAVAVAAPKSVPAAAVAVVAPAIATPDDAATSDDPYIETPRCTSCNECTQVNPRMFAYNENKQAYIKDLGAGTYKDLVEAAEGCQVAIIHPGKPRDPKEPGLDDLIARAQPFR